MNTKTKIIAAAAAIAALIPVGMAAATTDAHAASFQRCAGGTSATTRGGDTFALNAYRGYRMNCSSVRYAAKHLKYRVARQYGWPTANVSFGDGYVTWHCSQWGYGGYNVTCSEYSSGTSFRVRIGVYYH